jgi:hypothetical protein
MPSDALSPEFRQIRRGMQRDSWEDYRGSLRNRFHNRTRDRRTKSSALAACSKGRGVFGPHCGAQQIAARAKSVMLLAEAYGRSTGGGESRRRCAGGGHECKLAAVSEVQADYARHVTEALEQVQHLQEIIREAPADAVRNALSGLVERITVFFDYGPPRKKDGRCRTTLTSLEVQMRPEAAGLLGDQLRRSARSTS